MWRSWLESLPDDTTPERALGQPVPSAVPPSLRLPPEALIGHLLHVHQFLHAFGPQLGQSTDPHDPLGLAGLGLREIDAAVVHGDLPATHTLHITLLRQLAKCAIRHHEQLASDTERDAYHDFLASAETDDGVDDFLHLDAPTARAVLDTLAATHHAWPQLAYVCVRALCGAHRRPPAHPPVPRRPARPPARPPTRPPASRRRQPSRPARARGDAAGAAPRRVPRSRRHRALRATLDAVRPRAGDGDGAAAA